MKHILASIGLPIITRRRGVFKSLQYAVLPAIATVILIMITALSLYPPLQYPFNIAAYIGIAWIPLSLLMAYLERRIHPNAVENAEKLP